jgi:hydrogenase maturation protease
MTTEPRFLLIGYGNPGRRDDGLGPALATSVERWGRPGLRVETAYQLQIEHAAEVATHDRVLFVDADRRGAAPFAVRRVRPAASSLTFSTHSLTPEVVLALARDLFGSVPEAAVLGIRGHDFDGFGEGLSARAAANLQEALLYVESAVTQGQLPEFHPAEAPARDRECSELRG